ncbi:hypothetical protein ANO14919_070720 [Xylariales sp. No.14919]|nr:hypothetical protein ANO14919_070720 [Xylariales sp. No.14919]
MPVIKRLVEFSGGLFIWASTTRHFIREGRRLAINCISDSPTGRYSGIGHKEKLDEVYITVSRSCIQQGYHVEEKQEACKTLRDVLGSMAALFPPLPVDSPSRLLALSSSNINETLADHHTILNIPGRTNRPIRLHYPTFRDFLLNRTAHVKDTQKRYIWPAICRDSCKDVDSNLMRNEFLRCSSTQDNIDSTLITERAMRSPTMVAKPIVSSMNGSYIGSNRRRANREIASSLGAEKSMTNKTFFANDISPTPGSRRVAFGSVVEGRSHWVNSVADDMTLELWDLSTGTEKKTLRGYRGRVTTVLFPPDGRLVASGSEDMT